MRQLCFAEIGFHVEGIQGHQGQQGLTDAGVTANAGTSLGYDPAYWCLKTRIREIQLCGCQLGLCCGQRGAGLVQISEQDQPLLFG